jgi:hypothetical protein
MSGLILKVFILCSLEEWHIGKFRQGTQGLRAVDWANAATLPVPFMRNVQLGGVAIRLPAVAYSKRYSKVLEYEYRVKTAALGTLKRYSILSLTLYLE